MRAACILLILLLFHQQLQTSAWFGRWYRTRTIVKNNSNDKDCYRTWSRCSRWSDIATGWLWVTCDECCKCKGQATGQCQMNYSDTCASDNKAYYCDCYGTLNGKKPKVCSSFSNFVDRCGK